jgi:hypothetical protein
MEAGCNEITPFPFMEAACNNLASQEKKMSRTGKKKIKFAPGRFF